MHDLQQEMGRNIVYQDCAKKCGKHRRLLLFEDIINNILTKNMVRCYFENLSHIPFYIIQ